MPPNAPPSLPEDFLRDATGRARRAWPGIDVPIDAFAPYLRDRAERELGRGVPPGQLEVVDLYLCCACLRGMSSALAELEQGYLGPAIRQGCRHLRLSAPELDEVHQALRERLLIATGDSGGRLGQYTGRVPLAPWLRVIATRVALDLLPTRPQAALEELATEPEDPSPSPELDFLKTRYREGFSAAFASAVSGLAPEEQALLRLHYVDGLSVDRLAPIFGVHRATAARRVARVREQLLTALLEALKVRLKVTSRELSSLLTALPSGVDVSLRQLLKPS